MRSTSLLIVFLTVALTGCGTTTESSPPGSPVGGDVTTTAQALAFVAAEHAGTPSSATGENDAAEEFNSKAVGAAAIRLGWRVRRRHARSGGRPGPGQDGGRL